LRNGDGDLLVILAVHVVGERVAGQQLPGGGDLGFVELDSGVLFDLFNVAC
jgi:hypothetical protein